MDQHVAGTKDRHVARLEHLENLPSPEGVFEMVMEFARQYGKDPWLCFGQVFSPDFNTVVMINKDGEYFAYYCVRVTYDPECELLVNQGYYKYPVREPISIANRVGTMIADKTGTVPVRIIQYTTLPEKIWTKRYGFELSKERKYERPFVREE